MLIAIILILVAVVLFLIFHDDHDNSYTRKEPKSGRENGQKSIYQKSATPRRNAATPRKPVQQPRPTPVMGPRTIVPEEKQYRPQKLDERFKPGEPQPRYSSAPQRPAGSTAHASEFAYGSAKAPDFSYLDGIDYDPTLPERTMSSFIAGLQGYCSEADQGGVVGYVSIDPVTGALDVYSADDILMGYLPMKDRAAFLAFNPDRLPCPFAGHIGLSITGRYYADIRIVLPSSRTFVESSLRGFLG